MPSRKNSSKDQLSLFEVLEPKPRDSSEMTMKEGILEQLRIDVGALKEETDPWWREFFQNRIDSFRRWHSELEAAGKLHVTWKEYHRENLEIHARND